MNNEELEAALKANATASVPGPEPEFLRALEQRLMALDTSTADDRSTVVPFVRRARRVSGATLVITLAIAGVAAAATGIVVTHPFADDEPAAPVTVDTTDPVVTDTSVVETTVPAPVVTDAPTTVATTAAPVTTAAATTTTEVHTPATITLACHGTGSTVECSWSSLPAGTVKVVMLRGLAPYTGSGRAWGNLNPALASWTDDQSPALGSTYSYLIHAYDASGADLGHSNAVVLDCC